MCHRKRIDGYLRKQQYKCEFSGRKSMSGVVTSRRLVTDITGAMCDHVRARATCPNPGRDVHQLRPTPRIKKKKVTGRYTDSQGKPDWWKNPPMQQRSSYSAALTRGYSLEPWDEITDLLQHCTYTWVFTGTQRCNNRETPRWNNAAFTALYLHASIR